MQITPWMGFYWRQHDVLERRIQQFHKPKLILDLFHALMPVVREHWPTLNENGFLDDLESTVEESFKEPPTQAT